MTKATSGNLVWMDMEMTGLEPEKDAVIEIATVITDSDLNIIAKGPDLILNQPADRFDRMDDWNQKHHKESGLWDQVVASSVDLEQACRETLAFIKQHTREKESPLCGNSIWQDRRFLRRYMPDIDNYLHYRMIDVSTIKELTARWYGEDQVFDKGKESHRAMDDILESIEELVYYRSMFFK